MKFIERNMFDNFWGQGKVGGSGNALSPMAGKRTSKNIATPNV